MNASSDSTPKSRKEPHEEWREALIHAWKNRRGYTRQHDTAYSAAEDAFRHDEA